MDWKRFGEPNEREIHSTKHNVCRLFRQEHTYHMDVLQTTAWFTVLEQAWLQDWTHEQSSASLKCSRGKRWLLDLSEQQESTPLGEDEKKSHYY